MKCLSNTADMASRVIASLADTPFPSNDVERAQALFSSQSHTAETPLISSPHLSEEAGIASVHAKDERSRHGLGSFKALGAAYVIAQDAARGEAEGQTYVTASAGNHGISLAAGAAAHNARSVVFLADTVPEEFANRLRSLGADVQRQGKIYEDSIAAAEQASNDNGWILLSDSSWAGYYDRPRTLMEGYLVLMKEAVEQIPEPPTHIFLQAGVGGLATACAVQARASWGDAPRIVVVEPEAAPALFESIREGRAQTTSGPVSNMGRLDCKEPSLIALKGLARDADDFMLLTEDEGTRGSEMCREAGFETTPSGAAGVAGLLAASKIGAFGLNEHSRALVIVSERAE